MASCEVSRAAVVDRAMAEAPKMIVTRIAWQGKTAVSVMVTGIIPAALRDALDIAGVLPVAGLANTRERICTTPAEVDAARAPLKSYFGARGEWLGEGT